MKRILISLIMSIALLAAILTTALLMFILYMINPYFPLIFVIIGWVLIYMLGE